VSESKDITIPDLGDFSDVEIIEVLVAAGDTVAREDGLITLETDKATMDVPAPEDGVIEEITVSTGDRVSSGDRIGRMKPASGADDTTDDADKTAPAADAADSGDADDKDEAAEAPAQSAAGAPAESKDGASSAAHTSGAGERTVKVPDIGDFTDVDVNEVLVGEGDEVAVEDPLVTLETDKAAMDVPSTVAGTVRALKVSAGDKVSEGSEIAVIAVPAGDGEAAPAAKTAEKKAQDRSASAAAANGSADAQGDAPSAARRPRDAGQALPPIDEAGFSKAHASPSVRKLARELGVDLAQVEGGGPKQRILHHDVKAFVKSILGAQGAQSGGTALPKVPSVDFAKFGDVEAVPLTRIQKISGPRLQASWINLPHVTQHDLADITDLEARRQKLKGPAKQRGITLTPLAFIMKACIKALREFPKVNASLSSDETQLVYKKYYHLGFAADTENGLVVPVIRNADAMDVYELARALGELSAKARDGKLKAEQMQGASFTVSSLGGIGGTAFTPIINAPEVAILGVSRASMQPVWDGAEFQPRLMLPLSFSYDHRVIDGAYAVRFTTFLAEALTDVEAMLEAIP